MIANREAPTVLPPSSSQRTLKGILTGLLARIFDPLGLVTPVVAGLKLVLNDRHPLIQLEDFE